jgi:hypothetical protein
MNVRTWLVQLQICLRNICASIFILFLQYCLGESASGIYALRQGLQSITENRSNLVKKIQNAAACWSGLHALHNDWAIPGTSWVNFLPHNGCCESRAKYDSIILTSQESWNMDLVDWSCVCFLWGSWDNHFFPQEYFTWGFLLFIDKAKGLSFHNCVTLSDFSCSNWNSKPIGERVPLALKM